MNASKATAKRTSKGRQKIKIVKIANETNLQATFSKRRSGLFKKASEVCTLTDSEIAVVVFSPGERAYSFGSPSVNEIIDRFESQSLQILNPSSMVLDAHRRANVLNLNKELGSVEGNLDKERKRSEALTQMMTESSRGYWWASQSDELNKEALNQYRLDLEVLHREVKLIAGKVLPEKPQRYQTVQERNVYDVVAPAPVVSAPSSSIFMPSDASAFSPYGPSPTAAIHPTIPVFSYVGPTLVNNTISLKNGPSFTPGENRSGPSTPFDLNASGFCGGGCAGDVIPYRFELFNHGFGNGGEPS